MFRSKILAGLEIGTTKTCMVVGEVKPDATTTLLTIGEVPSAGVRKGEIVDTNMARQCVCDAWQMAQNDAEVDILSVVLSVTGDHIIGQTNTGTFRLPDNETVIDEEHAAKALEKARHLDVDEDRSIVNREDGSYSIDGRAQISNPVGLAGRTIEINSHIVHGISSRLKNSLHCVLSVPLEVTSIVFAPLATAQMVLSRSQKQEGALLIDIGGGTTDYVLYKDGEVVCLGCVPVGGNTINQDIVKLVPRCNSSVQRLSMKTAEKLKCTEGNAWEGLNDHRLVHYRSDNGLQDVSIECGLLNRIIRDRLGDTLMRIYQRIPSDLLYKGAFSVYLTGGTSLMRGLDGLAHRIFQQNEVFQPAPIDPTQPCSYQDDPRYCTGIGLIRYAQRLDAEREQNIGFFGRLKSFFGFGS